MIFTSFFLFSEHPIIETTKMTKIKYFILYLLVFFNNESQFTKIYSNENNFEKINSKDYIILSTATLLNVSNLLLEDYSKSELNDILNLNKDNINSFDRNLIFDYNEDYKYVSDATVIGSLALPFIYSLSSGKKFDEFLNYNVKYAQVVGLTAGFTLLSKNLITRYRPYAYQDNLVMDIRRKSDGRNSFFSGHTAMAFTGAVFFAYNFENSDYSRTIKNLAWAGSLALASSTGYLRIIAGKHFLTDVIVGAVVGSAVAILISESYYENFLITNTSSNFENMQINYLTFKFKI